MKYIVLFALFSTLSFAQGKYRGIEYRPLEPTYSEPKKSCLKLYDRVTRYGTDHGSYYNENFNWLESISLYKFNNQVYLVAWLKAKRKVKPYIYCDIQKYDWDLFANSSDFERAFTKYIHKYKCDCD